MKTSPPLLTTAALGLALLLIQAAGAFAAPATGSAAPTAVPTAEERTTFSNSVRALPATLAASARSVAPAELAGTMRFNVALKMRDLAALQERVGHGEILSEEELDRVFLPLQADYDRVAAWLVSQGFTITRTDASRIAVFATGTLAQVRDAFQVGVVKVNVDGVAYPAANSQPSLPARIAAPVLGVNGLQPYHRLRKHSKFLPQTANKAPFLINEILTAYDAKGTGYTGAGQTVAILIDTTPKTTDLTKFWTNNSVSQSLSNVTTINVNNETLPAVSGEETLDVEWSSGIAPGAKIRVYATGTLNDNDLDNGFARIISDLSGDATIHQLSISLGEGETYDTGSEFTTDAQYLATIASKGVSTFVSSGDGGSTPDDTGMGDEDTGPLQVEYYSSDPSVTAVGGTSLTLNGSTGARSAESAWSGSGGGVSIHFAKPSWQTGTGVPSGTKRYVPDVCMPADPNTGAYVYLNGSAQQIGGTSWSAPTWAGFCALLNEARADAGKSSMGLLNPSLYPLIGTSNFHDITSGSNAEGSKAGGKYPATTGYDEVTGIGSPDVAVLIKTLAGTTTPPASPTISGFTPASGPVGTSVAITGQNFSGVTSVAFNGTGAAYTVNSGTQVTATVPAAASTGKITVTTGSGTATSASSFTVTTTGGGGGATNLVVSQVYGGGGNSGATYTNDFIELFNPGTTTVSLGTYSVQYASATGSSYSLTKLSGSIAAGHYYLVQEAAGTSGDGTALPAADAAGTLNLSSTTGKVALVSSQSAITGPASAGVVDYVGFGSSANAYEGSGPAPTISNTASDLRANGGRTDTNDNKNDFAAGTPNPRNSGSAANKAGLAAWRARYFGTTGNTGDAADDVILAGDGLTNLTKYALGLDPREHVANLLTRDVEAGHLRLTLARNPAATDVVFTVEVTGTPENPASWTAAETTVDEDTAETLQVHDNVPTSPGVYRSIRLRVTRE